MQNSRVQPRSFTGYEASLSEVVFVGVVVIWGITFVVTKEALQVVGPFAYNTTRMMLGALTLALLAGPQWRAVDRSYLRPTLLVGLVLFLSYASQTYGQQFTSASKAGFLTGSNMVYVPIFSALFLRQIPRRASIFGVGLAFIGLILVSIQGSMGELTLSHGDTFVALSGIGWAVYIILLAYYAPRLSIMPFAALHVGVTALLNGVIWVGVEPLSLPLAAPAFWAGVLISGFFISGLGTSVHTWVMRWASPTKVGLIAAMEPLFAALAAWWVGETMTGQLLFGGTLILAGVLLAEFDARKDHTAGR